MLKLVHDGGVTIPTASGREGGTGGEEEGKQNNCWSSRPVGTENEGEGRKPWLHHTRPMELETNDRLRCCLEPLNELMFQIGGSAGVRSRGQSSRHARKTSFHFPEMHWRGGRLDK